MAKSKDNQLARHPTTRPTPLNAKQCNADVSDDSPVSHSGKPSATVSVIRQIQSNAQDSGDTFAEAAARTAIKYKEEADENDVMISKLRAEAEDRERVVKSQEKKISHLKEEKEELQENMGEIEQEKQKAEEALVRESALAEEQRIEIEEIKKENEEQVDKLYAFHHEEMQEIEKKNDEHVDELCAFHHEELEENDRQHRKKYEAQERYYQEQLRDQKEEMQRKHERDLEDARIHFQHPHNRPRHTKVSLKRPCDEYEEDQRQQQQQQQDDGDVQLYRAMAQNEQDFQLLLRDFKRRRISHLALQRKHERERRMEDAARKRAALKQSLKSKQQSLKSKGGATRKQKQAYKKRSNEEKESAAKDDDISKDFGRLVIADDATADTESTISEPASGVDAPSSVESKGAKVEEEDASTVGLPLFGWMN